MNETIRQHIKRRARLSMRILLWYFVVMIGLLAIARNRPWGGPLAGTLFVAMGVSLVWAAWIRCPKCGRWLSRNEFARFSWWFLREPDACPRCGVSYETPWDQPRVSR
jgi:hypothetical protein